MPSLESLASERAKVKEKLEEVTVEESKVSKRESLVAGQLIKRRTDLDGEVQQLPIWKKLVRSWVARQDPEILRLETESIALRSKLTKIQSEIDELTTQVDWLTKKKNPEGSESSQEGWSLGSCQKEASKCSPEA